MPRKKKKQKVAAAMESLVKTNNSLEEKKQIEKVSYIYKAYWYHQNKTPLKCEEKSITKECNKIISLLVENAICTQQAEGLQFVPAP